MARKTWVPRWVRRIVGSSMVGAVLVLSVLALVVVGVIGTVYMLATGAAGSMTRPPPTLDKPKADGAWVPPGWADIVGGVTDVYQGATTPEQRNALSNWWGGLWD